MNPLDYVPDLDQYLRFIVNYYDAFLKTNPWTVQVITGLTGWAVLSPFEIWERLKKRRLQ